MAAARQDLGNDLGRLAEVGRTIARANAPSIRPKRSHNRPAELALISFAFPIHGLHTATAHNLAGVAPRDWRAEIKERAVWMVRSDIKLAQSCARGALTLCTHCLARWMATNSRALTALIDHCLRLLSFSLSLFPSLSLSLSRALAINLRPPARPSTRSLARQVALAKR